jgi:hypothetical protein
MYILYIYDICYISCNIIILYHIYYTHIKTYKLRSHDIEHILYNIYDICYIL